MKINDEKIKHQLLDICLENIKFNIVHGFDITGYLYVLEKIKDKLYCFPHQNK